MSKKKVRFSPNIVEIERPSMKGDRKELLSFIRDLTNHHQDEAFLELNKAYIEYIDSDSKKIPYFSRMLTKALEKISLDPIKMSDHTYQDIMDMIKLWNSLVQSYKDKSSFSSSLLDAAQSRAIYIENFEQELNNIMSKKYSNSLDKIKDLLYHFQMHETELDNFEDDVDFTSPDSLNQLIYTLTGCFTEQDCLLKAQEKYSVRFNPFMQYALNEEEEQVISFFNPPPKSILKKNKSDDMEL